MSQLPHPRLAISSVLLGDYVNGWVAHFGLKCSTFSTMNCGTSGRTPCTPCGNWEFPSVLEGNLLASRFLGTELQNQTLFQYWFFVIAMFCVGMWAHDSWNIPFISLYIHEPLGKWLRVILLLCLAVCVNATILVEQPSNSLLECYPRFRDFLQMLMNTGGSNAVPWFSHWTK